MTNEQIMKRAAEKREFAKNLIRYELAKGNVLAIECVNDAVKERFGSGINQADVVEIRHELGIRKGAKTVDPSMATLAHTGKNTVAMTPQQRAAATRRANREAHAERIHQIRVAAGHKARQTRQRNLAARQAGTKQPSSKPSVQTAAQRKVRPPAERQRGFLREVQRLMREELKHQEYIIVRPTGAAEVVVKETHKFELKLD